MKRISLLIGLLFLLSGAAWGASRQMCFQCHPRAKFLKGRPHAPVLKGECVQCHQPHVSKFKKLLVKEPPDLCYSCHKKVKEELTSAVLVHPPFRQGACLRCHEAHTAPGSGLLKGSLNKVCFTCHKDLKRKFSHVHAPFGQGRCLACHEPHASGDRRLLKRKGAQLCLSCHKSSPALKKTHPGSLKTMDCLSCHNPHGSARKAILRDVSHTPYAEGKCVECHKKRKLGAALCFSCHKEVEKTFNHFHNHLLGGYSSNPCLLCHSPHLADTKAMLRDTPRRLCQRCHPETYKQREESLYSHPKWKECDACHAPHGSDHPAMLKGNGNDVCVRCHETQGKFTHPVGEKVRDPRNGQPVTCVTCHNTMGTNFKYNLRLSGEAALCVECHKNY